jgi:hypothetical protein
MKKLSELTRRENCFFTVDGKTLKTVQDLLEYLVDCDEGAYNNHVTSQKNDFANWVGTVLMFPELAESLKLSKTINEARDAIMEFFQVFDYRSQWINEEKAFHTVDGYKMKNVQELYYYVNNCDDASLQYHVNLEKNDFANWISDVLLFPSLAAKMRVATNRTNIVLALKEFLTTSTSYGANPEYERYINQRLVEDKETSDPNIQNVSANKINSSTSNASLQQVQQSTSQQVPQQLSQQKINVDQKSEKVETIEKIDKTGKVEEKINLEKKFEYVREEDPEKAPDPVFDKSGFRQYTDEELEKFVQFARVEKVDETDMKVEYLKTALQELKNMIKDLRRAEKDPLVADLMIRTITAKIDFYAISKNIDDYNHIIRLMKDVQHEIEECADQHSYNIAEEILKDLKLQGLAMKKA